MLIDESDDDDDGRQTILATNDDIKKNTKRGRHRGLMDTVHGIIIIIVS